PRHPLARETTLTAAKLLPHPFITREPGNAIRDLADQYFEAAGIGMEEVTIAAELGSLAAVKQLAAEGFGFGIASHAAIQRDIGEGRIAAVPLVPKLYTPLEVIFPKDKFRSRLITTFAEFAVEQLAAGAQR
nr:LysR substrate-binding domain-containing protein [Denitromonas sp.]